MSVPYQISTGIRKIDSIGNQLFLADVVDNVADKCLGHACSHSAARRRPGAQPSIVESSRVSLSAQAEKAAAGFHRSFSLFVGFLRELAFYSPASSC
ncbi:hypothetical protein Y1Q_0010787 [Alligator mississippiensis]|uniref:Uncharacterized protein n=1 Tax=Alligator mississippiensis TaxID=8496 RepID=A0A151M6U9_ALLMI|nr:hypothetical protein Y1Q_0010787 [Alligator mississippiensis]